jgi:tryptophanase
MLEMVRLTIPWRVYTRNHLDYVAASLHHVYQRRDRITTGYRIKYEAPIMRHFTIELEKT